MEFLDNGEVLLVMCSSCVASSTTRVIKIHSSLIFKSAPTGRIFVKFVEFLKICRENSSPIKI